ncbi:MAG: ABC transporter ATP-binding protein [Candidatus Fonsibacter ubiquis]|jgi:putative ABC transport system ATP-binding protein|nr:ABC transporter ATP-binding protein [Pseudomonadota bacterium]GDX35362.1 ABC transporter ATP-binding protein [Pelagibacterales bacterium]HRD24477.1 ABC transporter ATP-binding protein [Candidatus Fonsibacter ubiquis]
MKSLLELQDIYLNYKTENTLVEVIKGVNLKINSGENVAVVGKSGSGKTSLIMLIAGLEKATSGKIIFEDQDISTYSEDELADLRKRKIGIVFQSFYLIPNYTALENVSLVLEINKIENAQKKSAELLEQFGLKDRLNHFPSQLSGGEQQRVAIARSIILSPKLILADEPSGNLDSENSKLIINLLFKYSKQNNSSLILVTHDQSIAKECDKIIEIKDGKII